MASIKPRADRPIERPRETDGTEVQADLDEMRELDRLEQERKERQNDRDPLDDAD